MTRASWAGRPSELYSETLWPAMTLTWRKYLPSTSWLQVTQHRCSDKELAFNVSANHLYVSEASYHTDISANTFCILVEKSGHLLCLWPQTIGYLWWQVRASSTSLCRRKIDIFDKKSWNLYLRLWRLKTDICDEKSGNLLARLWLQKRVFQAKTWCFLNRNQVFFVLGPNHSTATVWNLEKHEAAK